MKTFIAAKIHGLMVTACHKDYHGSQGVPRSLLEATGIEPYEQVHVVNLANGQRWVTYVLPAPEGECTLNGAAALLGEPGDELILMVYRQSERFDGAVVVFPGPCNSVGEVTRYPATVYPVRHADPFR